MSGESDQDDYHEAPAAAPFNNMMYMDDLIQKFSGQDEAYSIAKFTQDIDDNADICQWSELQKLIVARRSLTGTAALWLKAERPYRSWKALKQALHKEFPDTLDSKTVHEIMTARKKKKDEGCLDYLLTMRELGKRGKMPDYVAIKYIVDGIQDVETNKIMLYGVTSYSELKEKLKIYEAIKEKMRPTQSSRHNETRNRQRSADNPPNKKCYSCGETSHLSNGCPHKQQGVKCFKCNQFGHISSQCPTRAIPNFNNNVESNKWPKQMCIHANELNEPMPFNGLNQQGVNQMCKCSHAIGCSSLSDRNETSGDRMNGCNYVTDGGDGGTNNMADTAEAMNVNLNRSNETRSCQKPMKIIKVFGQDISSLVDSGSDLNLISEACYSSLRAPEFVRNEILLTGFGAAHVKSLGYVSTNIVIDDDCFENVTFHVVPKDVMPFAIILGHDFLCNVTFVMDGSRVLLLKPDKSWFRYFMCGMGVSSAVVGFIEDPVLREEVERLVDTYRPEKTREAPIELRIIVKDDVPVAQRPRRLAIAEQKEVERQIKQWLEDGVIRAVERLKKVLVRASQYGLEINWKKCRLIQRSVEYLGHVIENGMVTPSPDKTEAVIRFPQPTTLKQLHSFIGLTSYFRKFIQDYASIARPLTDLLKKNAAFVFDVSHKKAFEELKVRLTSKPVLNIFNPELETELHTDASLVAYAAVLLQRSPEDGQLHPVHYMSKKTTDPEKLYTSYELEALAIIEGLKKFRPYLLGIKFKIITDCQAFEMTLAKRDLSTRVARWVLALSEYTYKMEHRTGSQMRHVDALSRAPHVGLVTRELHEQIKRAQELDDGMVAIHEILKDRSYLDYYTEGGVLYKGLQLAIPKGMEMDVIKKVHANGHFGKKKMMEAISKDYHIPDLAKKIDEFTVTCIPCLLATSKAGKQEGFLNCLEKDVIPMYTLHCDHIGPLSETKKLYNYILTIVDGFTKFVWIFPTKGTTAKETLDKLRIHQQAYGNPARIISDKGAAFTSNNFREYCDEEGIQHVTITTGVPRANGQVERVHRTIISVLTKLCVSDPGQWYKHVGRLQIALNSTYQRSINTTPFELMLGTKMRMKDDTDLCDLLLQEDRDAYVETRDQMRLSAKAQILKVQQENRRTYNQKRKPSVRYKTGDLVAIKRTQYGVCLKLKPRFLGPYRVVAVKGNDRYDVEKVNSASEGPIHTSTAADFMKPWPTLT